jgi:hypothetical protein
MKSMHGEERGIESTFARLAGTDAQVDRIATIAVAIWRSVADALSPIIGSGGVAALYRRSLHVSRTAHPWLAPTPADGSLAGELAALQALLQQQARDEAASATRTMLRTFDDLLVSLIGASLTEQLLASVWDTAARDRAAQDTSP